MSKLEKKEESSSIISNTVDKNNNNDTDSKEVFDDVNINEESPMETIQFIEPEPAAVTVDDVQMRPIEINDDDDEIEEDNDKGKKTVLNEECPPLPKRTSATSSLKKEVNAAAATTNNNNNINDNPILIQLKEAFPNIEEKYIISVIIASQGMMDPAFHALLYLSDPDSNKDIELPRANNLNNRLRDTSQLKQDELLARQLDQQYNSRLHNHSNRSRPRNGMRNNNNAFDMKSEEDIRLAEMRREDRRRRHRRPMTPEERREIYGDEDEDSWSHFVEKDIPEVANAVSTTFQETASKVSNWFNGVKNSWNNPQQNQYQYQQMHGLSRNNGYKYDQEQIREQEEALRFYERQKKRQDSQQQQQQKDLPSLAERRRFNSFGERVSEEDVLQTHGIMLKNDEFTDNEDVPPQLPKRERKQGLNNANKKNTVEDDNLYNEEANLSIITNENKIIPQTTYIDTPKEVAINNTQNNNDLNYTPTKANKNIELNEDIIINTDDEEL